MKIVGIDENGLGPILGPLVITGTLIETTRDSIPLIDKSNLLSIYDSKRIMGFRNMKKIEPTVLALTMLAKDKMPKRAEEVIELFSFEPLSKLKGECPLNFELPCWLKDPSLPLWSTSSNILEIKEKILVYFKTFKIQLKGIFSIIICPKRFNYAFRSLKNKLYLEVMFLKELFLYLSAFFAPRLFVCDKIGAMRYYQKVFRDLFGFSLEVIEEGPLYSKYRWRNGLALEFYRAADRTFLPVAISSMIGKYIREIWMQRVNSFFISKFQDLEPVSGYPNLRTYCFIKRTEVFLKKGKIHKDCFLRIC